MTFQSAQSNRTSREYPKGRTHSITLLLLLFLLLYPKLKPPSVGTASIHLLQSFLLSQSSLIQYSNFFLPSLLYHSCKFSLFYLGSSSLCPYLLSMKPLTAARKALSQSSAPARFPSQKLVVTSVTLQLMIRIIMR